MCLTRLRAGSRRRENVPCPRLPWSDREAPPDVSPRPVPRAAGPRTEVALGRPAPADMWRAAKRWRPGVVSEPRRAESVLTADLCRRHHLPHLLPSAAASGRGNPPDTTLSTTVMGNTRRDFHPGPKALPDHMPRHLILTLGNFIVRGRGRWGVKGEERKREGEGKRKGMEGKERKGKRKRREGKAWKERERQRREKEKRQGRGGEGMASLIPREP